MAAMAGRLALAVSPLRPRLAQTIAGWVIPALIGLAYASLIVRYWGDASGRFGSLAEVGVLFRHPGVLLAGWLHYLTFDLFVGAWEVREAQRISLPRWAVLSCLALTFLFGPIGLLLFLAVRAVRLRGLFVRPLGALP
jgi:hypothetical protein